MSANIEPQSGDTSASHTANDAISSQLLPSDETVSDETALDETATVESDTDHATRELDAAQHTSSSDDIRDIQKPRNLPTIEYSNYHEEPLAEVAEADGAGSDDDDDAEYEAPPPVIDAAATASAARYSEFDALFAQWRETGDPNIRDRLILMNRNLVAFIARKFLDRGEMSEDIMQQGLIGLINALDHFDPSRGTRFATFATPTIMGEIRRYLRDKTWTMRVPRRLQELHILINHRIELLTQQLDRSPTYVEIARSLGVEVEEVIEALEMPHAMEPMSIDETLPNARGDSATTISDQIGAVDSNLESWNDHAILQAALEKLPIRERQVLQLVYFKEHTQLEIARQLKISQMNVSRIQRRALARLRELMNSNDI